MHAVDDSLVPPDGGWGWMVVFGTALTNTFNQSLLSIFGLLFGDKLAAMGFTTFQTSWVANVMLFVTNFSGLISGPALKKYSARKVALLGSILTGLGMIASAYSTNIWHLIFSYGIVTGLGIGFIQPSSFVAVNSYFTTKRGMAVGISMAGTGVGQFLMPQLVGILLDQYGFSGTSLILGSLAFNGIIGASLYQPVKWHMKSKNSDEASLISSSSSSDLDENRNVTKYGSIKKMTNVAVTAPTTLEDVTVSLPIGHSSYDRYEKMERTTSISIDTPTESELELPLLPPIAVAPKPKESVISKIKILFDLDLLKSVTFINIIVSCGLGFTSNQSFNMFFPMYLQQEVNLDRKQSAMCMSAIAAADIVGRVTLPTLADKYKITSRTSYTLACISLALSRIVLSFQSQYIYVLLASTLCGFFRAVLAVNQNLIVSDHCKDNKAKLPVALGLNMVMKGISVISLGQLLGWVRDFTGSYFITIHAQNSLLFMIFALWTPEALYKYLHKEKG